MLLYGSEKGRIGTSVKPKQKMKSEQQLIAIAEMDGWTLQGSMTQGSHTEPMYYNALPYPRQVTANCLPPCLTSRDAIIPVIEKQSDKIKENVFVEMRKMAVGYDFLATPQQLCEALLKATGRWKEDKQYETTM